MAEYTVTQEFDSNTFGTTVESGKKEENKKGNTKRGIGTPKIMNYPTSRDNDSKAEYLEIIIEDYTQAGLNLPAFTFAADEEGSTNEGDKILKAAGGVTTDNATNFALSRGSDTNRKNIGERSKNKSLKHIINLPIPRNVTDTQGVQYGEGSLNPLEAFGTALVSAGFSPNQPIDRLKSAATAALGKSAEILGDTDTQNIFAATLSGSLIGALGGNVTPNQLISRATGQVLNPNLELLFNGVGLRVFPLRFEFFPRNRSEAITVMNIIKTLKYEMAPSRNKTDEAKNGIFIGAPSIFQLTYKKENKPHPFLNKFLPTFLSDMKVNYTASGSYSSFYDGTPTHILVECQFKEINPLFKEDYEESKGGVGY